MFQRTRVSSRRDNRARSRSGKTVSTAKSISFQPLRVARKKQPTQATTQTKMLEDTIGAIWPISPSRRAWWYTSAFFFLSPILPIPGRQTEISLERPRVSSWGCITWNVRSLLSRSHCTPLMGRVWYGDNMTHLRVIVEPDGTLCSQGPIMSATGAVLS